MLRSREVNPFLVVDADIDFLASLSSKSLTENVGTITEAITAGSGKEAQLILSEKTRNISGVFINADIQHPNVTSVIKFSVQHRPAMPVFVLYDQTLKFSEKELKAMGVQKIIQKPVSFKQLVELVSPSLVSFNAEEALTVGATKAHVDPLESEILVSDAEFVAINAKDFLAGSVCFFDIYVKIHSDKYVKILQSGDSFSSERLTSYVAKGVKSFFLRKEMHKHYLAYCDQLTASIVTSAKAGAGVKISQLMNHGNEAVKYLVDQGVDQANIKYATSFVKNVESYVKQLQPEKNAILKDFMSNVTMYDHASGVTFIAALLIRALNIVSADPVESVGIATMFHDIGLMKLGLTDLDEDEKKMTDEQKKVFYTHPVVGAEILAHVRGVKPIVIQAVTQHHERRSKKGFPDRIGAGSISLVAEVVGISDEYFQILTKEKDKKIENIRFELERRVLGAFSAPLVAEFRRVFNIKEDPNK